MGLYSSAPTASLAQSREVRRPVRLAAFSNDVFGSLIQQESHGQAGAVGPKTKYGRALGMTQLLPDTAKEQADKMGLAWRPDLLTGKTPEAASYQTQLGRSYFDEGLRKTGNIRDALHYYHGGPNRAQWGPKTYAYADAILGRLGNN